MNFITISAADVLGIVNAVVADPTALRIELCDRAYPLPTRDILEYIADNLWEPYKKVRRFMYGENYDCDNFSNSFFNLIQELRLGLCIGIEHLMIAPGKGHAINCFILDDRKFYNLEPQSNSFSAWVVLPNTPIWFIAMEGRETF
jgi:hypothetical protein